jgi:chorismate mutase
MVSAVRGAICVGGTARTLIYDAAKHLVSEILRSNRIREEDLISIIFSLTEDLNAGNPATGLRGDGFAQTPLFCAREPAIEGGMPRVIRVLVTWNMPWWRARAGRLGIRGQQIVPVYLEGAEALRPDLSSNTGG